MIVGMKSYSTMTISRAVTQLSEAYIALIKSGKSLKRFPLVMLWGAPGVGKSQGVRQIATAIEEHTGKQVDITDVRLLLFNPVDLRGIPTANADRTLTVPRSVTDIGDHAFNNCTNPNFAIYGFNDSAAESYAEANNIRFVELIQECPK